MKKFEYKTFTVPTKGWMNYKLDMGELETKLNFFGKQGWEIAASIGNVYETASYKKNIIILKREINLN